MDDFDAWNKLKKIINGKSQVKAKPPREGEVWMCMLGKNIGFEQDGGGNNFSRPVVIIRKFNNQMSWAVPLTTKLKGLDYYYKFSDPAGLEISAILAQMRLISPKRLTRKMYSLNKVELVKIRSALKSYL